MSAALLLPAVFAVGGPQPLCPETFNTSRRQTDLGRDPGTVANASTAAPAISLAFYRKYTEKLLRRYLYASMQVGRAPSVLGDSVGRGWASSRPIRTFEDAIIFVHDVETCLNQLGSLDRQMLSRIVLQEYTQAEAASLLGMSVRTISYKFPQALDRLTQKLLASGVLIIPQ
jgi:hypothetical protein